MRKKRHLRTVKLKRGIYFLPNLLTTAALFAGFFSVIVAMQGDFQSAAIGILVAMFLDGLDGRVARMTHTETDFGKEYDSMSDMVSFGLAPALVAYQWAVSEMGAAGLLWGRMGWLAAFFYAVAAALRLARFNSQAASKNDHYFQGLPSPSAAGLVGSSLWFATEYGLNGPLSVASALVLTVIAGALMVSNFPYRSFKDFDMVSRVGFRHLLLIPLLFMVIGIDPPLVLSLIFGCYALSGPVTYLWKKARGLPMDLPPILWFNEAKRTEKRTAKDQTEADSTQNNDATGTDA